MKPCRFFNSPSGCRFGSGCRFAHVGGAAPAPQPLSTYPYAAGPMVQPFAGDANYTMAAPTAPICQYFNSPRGCAHGMRCRFRHETEGQQQQRQAQADAEAAERERRMKALAHRAYKVKGPFYSLDVECVASGFGPQDRVVGRVSAVHDVFLGDGNAADAATARRAGPDEFDEVVVFDELVKPDVKVVSNLTPLTGIGAGELDNARSFEEVRASLLKVLPPNAALIGQGIAKDIEWLRLERGVHFREFFDVASLFRTPVGPERRIITFSLRHLCLRLFGVDMQDGSHNPVDDARYSLRIFNRYRRLHCDEAELQAVRSALLEGSRTPSFAMMMPYVDGVAMKAGLPKSTIAIEAEAQAAAEAEARAAMGVAVTKGARDIAEETAS